MIDEIKLFRHMIKYHPTIIGWLIKENIVKVANDKIVVCHKKSSKDDTSKYIKEYKGEVYHVYPNGKKRIPRIWDRLDNFTKIYGYNGDVSTILSNGIELFDIGNTSDIYCLTSQLDKLLVSCYDVVADIFFPEDFPRLKGDSVLSFIKWLECKHDFLEKNDYNFRGGVSQWGYLGLSGFSDYQPDVIDNIKKHGIFAYKPIYKRIEWTFDLVEKYKDLIVWKLLIEESNLCWTEDMLIKYDKYIPYCKDDASSYSDKFSTGFKAYDKLGHLSNKFLESHKDVLDWREVFSVCKFTWNADELTYFCNYVLNMNMPFTTDWPFQDNDMTLYSQFLYYERLLLGNTYFSWNPQNLLAFLLISDTFWDSVSEYSRLYKIFLAIPNVKKLAENRVTKEYFWETVCYNHEFPFDSYSREFNIDNIKRNKEEWSKQIENKFLGSRRTPDTNYYYYLVRTTWDEMISRKNIPLNYELALFLKDLNITIGGTYCQSDGGTIEEDHRWPVVNALKWFSNHHIENVAEIEKILDNQSLLDVFLSKDNTCNEDIVKYIIRTFLKRTTLQQYLDIVNELKDWNDIHDMK